MSKGGQLLIVGFEGKTAPPELLAKIFERRVGGVVLFARNLGSFEEIAALTRELALATPPGDPPLIISLDQEGGRVQRIKAPFPHWPPMARLGVLDDEKLSEAVGRAMGAEVAALGFNVDFAPVLDVHTNPANPIIGDRAFGTTAEGATRHALAFWRGLEAAGVRGCGKHYPGHGDTATDSHHVLPQVDADAERLRSVELPPFAAAVEAGVPMIMTAHVVYPAVDDKPATLSRIWLAKMLRTDLGFEGVVVSDDLDMKAVAEKFPVEQTVVESLLAGADCFLACRDPEIQGRAEAALDAAAEDPATRVRVLESTARLANFRCTLATSATPVQQLALAEHAALADRLR